MPKMWIEEEDFLHFVKDCPRSKRLWQLLGFYDSGFFTTSSARRWLRMGSEVANSFLFLAGHWAAWTHINKESIMKKVTEIHQIAREATWNAHTILTSFHVLQKLPLAPQWVSWHPEGEGEVVLNVDGSCVTNPR